jgi:hypothetical protein
LSNHVILAEDTGVDCDTRIPQWRTASPAKDFTWCTGTSDEGPDHGAFREESKAHRKSDELGFGHHKGNVFIALPVWLTEVKTVFVLITQRSSGCSDQPDTKTSCDQPEYD